MTQSRTVWLTSIAMFAFAGNSLLCRAALHDGSLDAGTFAMVRTVSATLTLVIWLAFTGRIRSLASFDWPIAAALALYMATFTFAYLELSTGVGALLLFGFAQLTMLGSGLLAGERLSGAGWFGVLLAIGGLFSIVAPTLSDTPTVAALVMAVAGIAWGIYSLLGRAADNPIEATAISFVYALPVVVVFSVPLVDVAAMTATGLAFATISGVVTSAVGYVIWFAALPRLRQTTAGTAQLSSPVLSALAGIVFLAEPLSIELLLASVATLGGIALVLTRRDAN